MMKIKINETNQGFYLDSDIKHALQNLIEEIEKFVPNGSSHTNLSLKRTGRMAIDKTKSIKKSVKTRVGIFRSAVYDLSKT